MAKTSVGLPSTAFLDSTLGRPKRTVDQTHPTHKICEHCGTPFPFKGNKKFCNSNCRKQHWDAAHPKRKAS